jgi:hypothetical protein
MCRLSVCVNPCKPFLVLALMSYFSYTCGVYFDVLILPLCPPCYPTQHFGPEDRVSRRWMFPKDGVFLKTVSLLGWCTPGQPSYGDGVPFH